MEKVLADDLSGAAEVAGVAHRYGLTAGVHLDPRSPPAWELTVFDTDSRSMSCDEAASLIQSLVGHGPWVFKKIDSVLRGHVLAEIEPLLESSNCRRALVVASNPALRRVIRNGAYWVEGRLISETAFGRDPEHPALSSDIIARLGASRLPVRVCKLADYLPESGVIVGEAETEEEIRAWASQIDEETIPVGSAAFFAAWLESRGRAAKPRACEGTAGKTLVISGTTSRVVDWRLAGENGQVKVLPMPPEVFEAKDSGGAQAAWAEAVVAAVESAGVAVASIGGEDLLLKSQSPRLLSSLADLAASILARHSVDRLWLEGGATASAVIRRMGWNSLRAVGEVGPGVGQYQPTSGGPLVTIKPGSYPLDVHQFQG